MPQAKYKLLHFNVKKRSSKYIDLWPLITCVKSKIAIVLALTCFLFEPKQ